MAIELRRFKESSINSSLPNELKIKIDRISFKYENKKIRDSSMIYILAILTFGIWMAILWYRHQVKRKAALQDLKDQVSGFPAYIQLNF